MLLATIALSAQTPNYEGIWQITPPLAYSPLVLYSTDYMRIVAQPPSLRCQFGAQFGSILWGGTLTGSLSSPTSATVSLQTPNSQCVWSYVANLTFTGPDQITGILQSTDLYNCFYSGTVTQSFTAQRLPVGMYEPYAEGCAFPLPTPTLSSTSIPSLSAGFDITLSSVPANLAFLATGFSNTSFGSLTLPHSLAPYGMAGCDLQVDIEFAELLMGGSTVQTSWAFPNAPGLLGSRFYQQAWALAPFANALGAKMSNAMVGVIGP